MSELTVPDTCPICRKEFMSEKCPHSIFQVQRHQEQSKFDSHLRKLIREIVREGLKNAGSTTL